MPMPVRDLFIKLNRLDLENKQSRKVTTLVRKRKLRSDSPLTDVKKTRQSNADKLGRRISNQLECDAHGIAGE